MSKHCGDAFAKWLAEGESREHAPASVAYKEGWDSATALALPAILVAYSVLEGQIDGMAEQALLQCRELFTKALPALNWGASALDAEAIALLNTVPAIVEAALKEYGK